MPPQLGCCRSQAARPRGHRQVRPRSSRRLWAEQLRPRQGQPNQSSATRSRWLARFTPRPKRPCFPATASNCPAGYEPLRHNRPTIPFLEPIRLGGARWDSRLTVTRRRGSCDEVAEDDNRWRAGYLDEVVEDVLGCAHIESSGRVPEVGSGTGQFGVSRPPERLTIPRTRAGWPECERRASLGAKAA